MFPHNDHAPIIIGCGFLGSYLAKILLGKRLNPTCIVSSSASASALCSAGYSSYILDLDNEFTADDINLKNRDIYYLVPPNRTDLCDQRMDHFLSLCKLNPPRKILYISTSGVYGDCDGNWVDEKQPLAPISDRATRRVYAEKALMKFCLVHPTKYIILRVGGIYGPNRLPIHRLSSITVICPDQAPYSNRIHVYDLAATCFAAMGSNVSNDIFNVADGNPTTMTDFYYKIADYAGKKRPTCVPMSQAGEKISPAMLSFINESRRLSIYKIQTKLAIKLQYPTLDSGLKNCFRKTRLKYL